MVERIDFQSREVDRTLEEMAVFNELVEEIDQSVSDELKKELETVAGGKFGQNKDFSGGFGQER